MGPEALLTELGGEGGSWSALFWMAGCGFAEGCLVGEAEGMGSLDSDDFALGDRMTRGEAGAMNCCMRWLTSCGCLREDPGMVAGESATAASVGTLVVVGVGVVPVMVVAEETEAERDGAGKEKVKDDVGGDVTTRAGAPASRSRSELEAGMDPEEDGDCSGCADVPEPGGAAPDILTDSTEAWLWMDGTAKLFWG